MVERGVHRLPIIDNDGSIVLSLTYRSICRFLVSKFRFNAAVLSVPVLESGVALTDFCRLNYDATVYDAILLLVKHNLSMIPLFDNEGRIYNVFSKYDFSHWGSSGRIDLTARARDLVDARPEGIEGCVTTP